MSIYNLRVLVVDDEAQMRSALKSTLESLGATVSLSQNGKEALSLLENNSFDLVISDMRMPICTGEELLKEISTKYQSTPVVMITAYGTITQAVDAMRLGAFDFITKPFSLEDIEGLLERLVKKPPTYTASLTENKKSTKDSVALITNDPKMREIIQTVTHVASSSASVFIQGESGTGKELIAKLLHISNQNISGNFIAVNCAALPENLLESELFGHEKGSFTGALSTRIGKFEQANGGTILLDEISEMPLALQAKLLRVLQEREVDRIGGAKPIPVQVRVVATSNRNILDSVRKGEFREDLYYRLNVIPVYIPSLRERKSDIKLLVEYFISKFSDTTPKIIDKDVMEQLQNYRWPGNIRELQNACERAALLSKEKNLKFSDFITNQAYENEIQQSTKETGLKAGVTVAEAEKSLIFETLKVTDNNKTKAAEMLGISIRTLRNKLHEYSDGQCREFDGE